MKHATVIVVLLALGISGALIAGCMESVGQEEITNRTDTAISLALNDSVVREQIPIATGAYEIVYVGPVQYEQTGPGGGFSGTVTAVTFRCCNQSSLYRVFVDGANSTIVNRGWQWVKEPMPCSGTESPQEFSTLDEASAALVPGCALAAPSAIPAGYHLSLVRVYGEPCPRRDICYESCDDTLRLVQTCNGSPPFAFAISGNGADDVTVRGGHGEFVRGIGENQVTWSDENCSYWLLGPLEKDELLEVASSVQPFAPAASLVSGRGQRHSVNVLRGNPFAVNGSVGNSAITQVQVWVLDGEITTHSIPVMPDGTFQFTLGKEETRAFSRYFSIAVVVHFPQPPDHFTITWDESEGKAVAAGEEIPHSLLLHLQDKTLYPTTLADYLEQAILKSGQGNAVETYFINGVDGWITIEPAVPTRPGTLEVSGSTSLPEGTPLSITVMTALFHPTPKNYDWSHEMSDGTTRVLPGTGGINSFSCNIDTSELYPGNYLIGVESRDDSLQADAMGTVEIIAPAAGMEAEGNNIDWSRLDIPPLVVNKSIGPEMLEGELRLVLPGTTVHNNEIPYGSIIDCAPDGICRVFDQSGVQILAVYYSNEARMIEVPNGAMIDSERVGNVTFIELGGDVILVKIDEYTKGT